MVLLDADPDFAQQDRTALADFPGTTEELSKYDVIIFGDCDPNDPKLGEQRLKNLVEFVSGGGTTKGQPTMSKGGGLLFVAGTQHNPHSYKNTPLAKILPVIPDDRPDIPDRPADDEFRDQKYRLEWTPSGKHHPIFKFTADETESQTIWRRPGPAVLVVEGLLGRPDRRGPGRASDPEGGQAQAGPGPAPSAHRSAVRRLGPDHVFRLR